MSTHKYIEGICAAGMVLSLVIAFLFLNTAASGVWEAAKPMGYEGRLFDTSRVHTIDIVMDGWDSFIEECENEEYAAATAVIDGESFQNVGIRAKGNTSLRTVSEMDSDRYSFKIEFDQYDDAKNYYGLDKLSLNNLIQDTTYMKDYLTYRLMGSFGVDAPLCSYAFITVNGEDWGLYLAVEGVEEGFLQRNYGSSYGELYKPDSTGLGGGRGNGKEFDMGNWEEEAGNGSGDGGSWQGRGEMPDSDSRQGRRDKPGGDNGQNNADMPDNGQEPGNGGEPGAGEGFGGRERFPVSGGEVPPDKGMGSDDVKLKYIDDDPDSYPNIFQNAKTDIGSADKKRLIESLKKLGEREDIESAVNADEVIRYFTVHNFVVNGDSYTGQIVHNYYLYEEDGRLSMIPWDYNLAFGTFQSNDAQRAVNDPIDTPLSVSNEEDRPMFGWIVSKDEYTELYHQYLAEFIQNTDIEGLIDKTEKMIAPYVEKDPGAFYSYEEFEAGVAALREFCSLRAESIQGQLNGTVPSTAQEQAANPSSLISCRQLKLSDMGTMDAGMVNKR